jgi:hydrogenase maturation protease
MGDDALGPTVIATLEASYEMAEDVALVDLGTPGLDLVPHLAGLDAVVIVDTVNATGSPGDVRTYNRDELLAHPPPQRVSPHDPGLKEALLALEFAGQAPKDVLLVGVIPGSVERGTELSPAVAAAVPGAVGRVLDALAELGVPAQAKATPGAPHLWWRA